jgi:hypothetical protein
MTAANSAALSDAPSTVLLASEDWAGTRPAHPRLCHRGQTAAVTSTSEGLLMAPRLRDAPMLDVPGSGWGTLDYYGSRGLAAQVLCTLAAWEDDAFCRGSRARGPPARSTAEAQRQRRQLPPPPSPRPRRTSPSRRYTGRRAGVVSTSRRRPGRKAILEGPEGSATATHRSSTPRSPRRRWPTARLPQPDELERRRRWPVFSGRSPGRWARLAKRRRPPRIRSSAPAPRARRALVARDR